MKTYTVWANKGVGVKEKCLRKENGDYVGVKTGGIYRTEFHDHSFQYPAKIVSADDVNTTGMHHLSEGWTEDAEENRKSWKAKFIGCEVTVEAAHYYDGVKVYRCLELEEYFSGNEIEIIK